MQQPSELLTILRRIGKCYDDMLKPVCGRYRLFPIEAAIISFLYNNPGKDTAADIVELRMLSKGNVSRAVESLMHKSLLKRRQDTKDRRKIHLSLTQQALPITQEIEQVRRSFRARVLRGFTEKEKELLAQFNDRIAQNMLVEEQEST